MGLVDDTCVPYRIRFRDAAKRVVGAFDGGARDRLDRALAQLAELASFGSVLSSGGPFDRLVADNGEFSIQYRIDDTLQELTVFEVERS